MGDLADDKVVPFPAPADGVHTFRHAVVMLGEAARASVTAEDPVGEVQRIAGQLLRLTGGNEHIRDVCVALLANAAATECAIRDARRRRKQIIGLFESGKIQLREYRD